MATKSKRRRGRPTPTQARAARRAKRGTRRRLLRIAAFTAVGTLAAVFIFSLFASSLRPSPRGSGPDGPGERINSQRTTHILRSETHPAYNSVPATSGWHYADTSSPARWGVYDEPIPDEVLVHNLEHAGVGIHYNCPEGCDELVGQLEEIAKRASKVIMSPNPDIDTTIVLTAWTFLDKFDEFDKERVEAFISAHVNSPNAPEADAR